MPQKAPEAFRTISEVAEWLGVNTHVLRFWESKFSQVKPVKRAGGRRYYRPSDMELLGGIQKLLHEDGLTVKGAQKVLREQGVKAVCAMSRPIDEPSSEAVGSGEPSTVPSGNTIFNAPAPRPLDVGSETVGQRPPGSLPLFSERKLPDSLPGAGSDAARPAVSAPLQEEPAQEAATSPLGSDETKDLQANADHVADPVSATLETDESLDASGDLATSETVEASAEGTSVPADGVPTDDLAPQEDVPTEAPNPEASASLDQSEDATNSQGVAESVDPPEMAQPVPDGETDLQVTPPVSRAANAAPDTSSEEATTASTGPTGVSESASETTGDGDAAEAHELQGIEKDEGEAADAGSPVELNTSTITEEIGEPTAPKGTTNAETEQESDSLQAVGANIDAEETHADVDAPDSGHISDGSTTEEPEAVALPDLAGTDANESPLPKSPILASDGAPDPGAMGVGDPQVPPIEEAPVSLEAIDEGASDADQSGHSNAEPPEAALATAPVIAPLPDPSLPLVERLERLFPGQVPADRLRPIHGKLVALRTRMDASGATR